MSRLIIGFVGKAGSGKDTVRRAMIHTLNELAPLSYFLQRDDTIAAEVAASPRVLSSVYDEVLSYSNGSRGLYISTRPFATQLKKMAAAMFDMHVADIEYFKRQDTSVLQVDARKFTMREVLQLLGTEAGRGVFGDNLWVSLWERHLPPVEKKSGNVSVVFVPDVRFPNEAQRIKELGGVLIRVTRPGHSEGDGHESEAYADELDVDIEIVNDKGLGDLFKQAADIITSLYLAETQK